MPRHDTDTGGQILRFAVIGMLNTSAGVAIIFFCYKVVGLSLIASNAAGYGVGVVLSFVLNRSWTFGVSSNNFKTVINYLVLVGAAFVLNMLVIKHLISLDLPYWGSQIAGVVTYSTVVFLGMKHVIFTT